MLHVALNKEKWPSYGETASKLTFGLVHVDENLVKKAWERTRTKDMQLHAAPKWKCFGPETVTGS